MPTCLVRLLTACLFMPAAGAAAQASPAPELRCVSLGALNRPAGRTQPSLSFDGRVVVYIAKQASSSATKAVLGAGHVVHVVDLKSGELRLVPVQLDGKAWGLMPLEGVSLSADARTGALAASYLAGGPGTDEPPHSVSRLLVVDLVESSLRVVTLGDDAALGEVASKPPFLSAEGRHVLTPTQANYAKGIEVEKACLAWHDLQTGETRPLRIDGVQFPPQSGSCTPDGGTVMMCGLTRDAEKPDASLGLYVWHAEDGLVQPVKVDVSPQARAGAVGPVLSADGRWVVFTSSAADLVPDDTNGQPDVFLLELATGRLTRVSLSSDGKQADAGPTGTLSISADGRCIAFASAAQGLVPEDSDRVTDAFVHDMRTGRTVRVNVAADGSSTGTWDCLPPVLSGDGQWVAFATSAALVAEDTADGTDVYVRRLAWDDEVGH
jgi:WD40-like Beta Propeller Repeat